MSAKEKTGGRKFARSMRQVLVDASVRQSNLGLRITALEEIDLAILKDDPFLLFPREIAPTLYDTIVDACRKAGFQPVIGQVADRCNVWRESRGRGTRRIARSSGDDAIARDRHCLPADCGAVANDPPCPRLPARRDVAGGAQFRRPRRFVMLSGLCPRFSTKAANSAAQPTSASPRKLALGA
jgi:hypothetical protein